MLRPFRPAPSGETVSKGSVANNLKPKAMPALIGRDLCTHFKIPYRPSRSRHLARLPALQGCPRTESCTGGIQSSKHSVVPERNPSDANARRIVDRVSDGGEHRFERGLTGSIGRQVRTVRIRISVHQQDIDALGNVGMPESRMREPIHARYL